MRHVPGPQPLLQEMAWISQAPDAGHPCSVSTVSEEPGMCPGGGSLDSCTSLASLALVDKLLRVSPGRAGGPAGRPSPSTMPTVGLGPVTLTPQGPGNAVTDCNL